MKLSDSAYTALRDEIGHLLRSIEQAHTAASGDEASIYWGQEQRRRRAGPGGDDG